MAPGFSRSHSRTSSLPCSTHPLLSHLQAKIRATCSWLANSDRDPGPATGLHHVDALISNLEQVLNLPESRESLCHADSAESTDWLLDNLLCLADVYGSVRSVAITLKQNHAELHAALRRHDAPRVGASIKTKRRIEKEICQLAGIVRHVASGGTAGTSDTEVGIVVREAVTVAGVASVEVLSKVVSVSSTAGSSAMVAVGLSRTSRLFKKRCSEEEKEAAMEKLEVLEECVVELESGSESVFRSLVKARVTLLNAVTLSF